MSTIYYILKIGLFLDLTIVLYLVPIKKTTFYARMLMRLGKKIFPFDLKYAKQTFQIMHGASFNEREILLRPFKHFKRNKLKSCLDE
jgi:hypothetical protein